MNVERLSNAYRTAKEGTRQLIGALTVVATTGGGAGGAGFGGYKVGNAIGPNNAHTTSGKILEHGVEAAGAGALGLAGAAIGFGIGVWIIDGGLVEMMEGGP